MTTSILSYMNNSSSNPAFGSTSKPKNATTFIIQPPSLSTTMPNSLLTKRCKPAELGDLLKKKIKTQASPNLSEDESTSMIEEIASPSTKSVCNEADKDNFSLFAQRSVSTPIVFSNLLPKATSSHSQLQTALKSLQKKILLEQHNASLREMSLQAQATQERPVIPPFLSTSSLTVSPVKKVKFQDDKSSVRSDDEEPEVIYGDIEYPFLSMSVPINVAENVQNVPVATPAKYQRPVEGLTLESLAVTRSETQKSDSEMSEELSESSEGKKKRSKKSSVEKAKKTEKKGKEQNKEPLSPVLTPRRKKLAERKLNKWQIGQDEKMNETKGITPVGPKYQVEIPAFNSKGQSGEKRVIKMKSSPQA